jgi:hypothetical protein
MWGKRVSGHEFPHKKTTEWVKSERADPDWPLKHWRYDTMNPILTKEKIKSSMADNLIT